ncbi:MAG: hypothetical protein ACLR56_14555 [Oscillospiraceae bacterium]
MLGDNRNDSVDSRDSRIGDGGLVWVCHGSSVLRVSVFKLGRLDNDDGQE